LRFAENGEEVQDIMAERPFDVIVSDMRSVGVASRNVPPGVSGLH
jgi:hypothetical protein